jgi:hypothetical protein
MPEMPSARGEASEALIAELRRPVHRLAEIDEPRPADAIADDDLQLALYRR